MVIADLLERAKDFAPVDGEKLDELISGCTIVGAEPIDYPCTDGALLYLKDGSGALAILELGVDEENGGLYIQLARV